MAEDKEGYGILIQNLAEASEKIVESFDSVGKIEIIVKLPAEELDKIKNDMKEMKDMMKLILSKLDSNSYILKNGF
jgi:hypothetical protein